MSANIAGESHPPLLADHALTAITRGMSLLVNRSMLPSKCEGRISIQSSLISKKEERNPVTKRF